MSSSWFLVGTRGQARKNRTTGGDDVLPVKLRQRASREGIQVALEVPDVGDHTRRPFRAPLEVWDRHNKLFFVVDVPLFDDPGPGGAQIDGGVEDVHQADMNVGEPRMGLVRGEKSP